jgi:hypothetical protein
MRLSTAVRLALCAASLLSPAATAAQESSELTRPADWVVRADDPSADVDPEALFFVSMPPGWHVTTGPAVLLYDPANDVEGEFDVELEAYRFPGETAGGYGLFLAGHFHDEVALYFAFLVDREGRYRLYHAALPRIHEIVPWTVHPAVTARAPEPDAANAKNVLRAEVRADSIAFLVNDQRVAAFARPAHFDGDGVVGLRIEEGVDVHVTRLDVVPVGSGAGEGGPGEGGAQ